MTAQSQTLVVTNPPHGIVDHEAVAALLGLDLENAALKIRFWAPEVLSASDSDRDGELASSLRRLGMSVTVVDAKDLSVVPWGRLATSLSFAPDGLSVRFSPGDGAGADAESSLLIPYDRPAFVTHCRPPAGFVAPESEPSDSTGGLRTAEAVQWMSSLDLYVDVAGTTRRVTLARDLTDFSEIGVRLEDGPEDHLAAAADACRRYFRQTTFDARLVGVRPRQRFQIGASGFDLDMRKLFSFGTLLLRQVLQFASEELGDLPQYELGSRMAYVLRARGRP